MALRDCFDRLLQTVSPVIADTPLLDARQLAALMDTAQGLPESPIRFERPLAHPWVGDLASCGRGRGGEFEDNRRYQPGDELRLLNWRLFARSGVLYSKVFVEERRPACLVVVDRRESMCFGTRVQPKISLAAQLAVAVTAQAQQQGLACGALLLDNKLDWFDAMPGGQHLNTVLQAIVAPCAACREVPRQSHFHDALQLLMQRIAAGSFIILLSDFHDLDARASEPWLQSLAQKHNLLAVQILDRVELEWPTRGRYRIDNGDAEPLLLDAGDGAQADAYRHAFEQQQQPLIEVMQRSGIPFYRFTADRSVTDCMSALYVEHPLQ